METLHSILFWGFFLFLSFFNEALLTSISISFLLVSTCVPFSPSCSFASSAVFILIAVSHMFSLFHETYLAYELGLHLSEKYPPCSPQNAAYLYYYFYCLTTEYRHLISGLMTDFFMWSNYEP